MSGAQAVIWPEVLTDQSDPVLHNGRCILVLPVQHLAAQQFLKTDQYKVDLSLTSLIVPNLQFRMDLSLGVMSMLEFHLNQRLSNPVRTTWHLDIPRMTFLHIYYCMERNIMFLPSCNNLYEEQMLSSTCWWQSMGLAVTYLTSVLVVDRPHGFWLVKLTWYAMLRVVITDLPVVDCHPLSPT